MLNIPSFLALNTLAADTSNSANTSQQQSLQAQMDTLTKKRIQELEYHMARMSRQLDARINGIVRRASGERMTQQRTLRWETYMLLLQSYWSFSE